MKTVRVAAVQAASRAGSWEQKWEGADVAHALALLDRAAAGGADLACLPELYPLVGREALCAKAREHGMHVVAGLADGIRRRWYNTSVIIDSTGTQLHAQTKQKLRGSSPAAERSQVHEPRPVTTSRCSGRPSTRYRTAGRLRIIGQGTAG